MKIFLILVCVLLNSVTHADRLLDPMPRTMSAHEYNLPDLAGKKHKLSDLKGKFVLINFWATSCTICRAELTTLQDMYDQLRHDSEFEIVAIHAGDDLQGVEELLALSPVSYSMLMDMDLELGHWGIPTLPTTYLITPDGMFSYRALGTRVWNAPNMIDFMHQIFDDYHANKAN